MSARANRGLLFGLVFIAALMCVPTASAQIPYAGGDWEYFIPFDYDYNFCPIWELSGSYSADVDEYCTMDFALAQDENGGITGVGEGDGVDGPFYVYITGTIKGTGQTVNTGDYGTVKVNLKFTLDGTDTPFNAILEAKMELYVGEGAYLDGTIRRTAQHNTSIPKGTAEFSFDLGAKADGSWFLWVDPIVTKARGVGVTLGAGFAAANVSSQWYGSIYDNPENGHWLVFNLNGSRNEKENVAGMTLKGLKSYSQNPEAWDYFWEAEYNDGLPVSFKALEKTNITLTNVVHDYVDDDLYDYFSETYEEDYYFATDVFGEIRVNILGQQAYTPNKGDSFIGGLNVAGPDVSEDEGEFGFWWWYGD